MSTVLATPPLPIAVAPALPIVNALTVDVEDYFQVSAFAPHIARSEWDTRECRVERNIERILALLADAHATATFFTLGWIAERYPDLVRRIGDAGHELASHGHAHGCHNGNVPQSFTQNAKERRARRGGRHVRSSHGDLCYTGESRKARKTGKQG